MAADRTGLRLTGPAIETLEQWGDRPSEPQVTGTIQITIGGTPIVIGPDGPTIGGYPKIAVVIDADRDRLGQVKPGDRLRFRQIEIDDARTLRREYHTRLRQAFAARS
jgi:allophanate hydrolase subunit 2